MAAPESPSHDSSPEFRSSCDRRRKLCEEVAHAADERHEQQDEQPVTTSAEPSTVTVAASPRDMRVLAIDEPHRVLEDQRQEDADEDDQERVADCDERRHHGDGGRDDEQRAHRQEQLDPALVGSIHVPSVETRPVAPPGAAPTGDVVPPREAGRLGGPDARFDWSRVGSQDA